VNEQVPAPTGSGDADCMNYFVKRNRIYGIKSAVSTIKMEYTGMAEASIP
jgi:hypothetical protein